MCSHAPRRIEWPGGEALLTLAGHWTVTRRSRRGVVEKLHPGDPCPGCGADLWGLPRQRPAPDLPAEAHAEARHA